MRIYVINLDRHTARWQRISEMLKGLPFERIAAVDGRTWEGPETRQAARPVGYEHLNKYERAGMVSHRAAWTKILESGERFGCVLEDDVYVSPSLGDFIRDESWIPADGTLIKIETCNQPVALSRRAIQAKGRRLASLRSRHLGAAAYIMSRDAIANYMEKTNPPDRGLDYIMFGESAVKETPIYQLCPALCTQAKDRRGGIIFPELESAVQFYAPSPRKPLIVRLRREIPRPFVQLGGILWSIASGRRFSEQRWPRVEFA